MEEGAAVRWVILAPIAVGVFLSAACAQGAAPVVAQDVVSRIPWTTPETANYRLLDDDEVKGSAVLRIEAEGDRLRLAQEFEDVDEEFRDRVLVVVDGLTLKPARVERVIQGPDGERVWEVDYSVGAAEVRQRTKEDRRTDQLEVPPHSYDSWSDLFLWRTIDFRRGYTVSYSDVGTAVLAKPQRSRTTLEVITRERVTVPAGIFDTWRLEVRLEGKVQRAWIADTPQRSLVRYDSGDLRWELESLR